MMIIDFQNVICANCRFVLQQCDNDNGRQFQEKIKLFDFSKITKAIPLTRSSLSMNGDCKCIVCNIARNSGLKPFAKKIHGQQPGRRENSNKIAKKVPDSRRKIIKMCNRCLQKTGKGIVHNCSQKNRKDNLMNLVDPKQEKCKRECSGFNCKSKNKI